MADDSEDTMKALRLDLHGEWVQTQGEMVKTWKVFTQPGLQMLNAFDLVGDKIVEAETTELVYERCDVIVNGECIHVYIPTGCREDLTVVMKLMTISNRAARLRELKEIEEEFMVMLLRQPSFDVIGWIVRHVQDKIEKLEKSGC